MSTQEENNIIDDMDFSDVAESLEADMSSAQSTALKEDSKETIVEDENQDSSPEDIDQADASEEDNSPYNPGNVEIKRQEHETDEMFEARKDIARFKMAAMSTDDEELKKDFNRLKREKRKELAEIARSQKEDINPINNNLDTQPNELDLDSMSDEEYNDYVFKQMMSKHGLMTKEEFEAQQRAKTESQMADAEIKLQQQFVAKHPEYRDDKLFDGLVDYLNDFYNLDGKTPAQLAYLLEKAHLEFSGVDLTASISNGTRASSVIDTMSFNNSSAVGSSNSLPKEDKQVLDKYKINIDDIDVDQLI